MQISETATSQIVDQMVVRMKDLMEEISDHEDFEIIASSHKAGGGPQKSQLMSTWKTGSPARKLLIFRFQDLCQEMTALQIYIISENLQLSSIVGTSKFVYSRSQSLEDPS